MNIPNLITILRIILVPVLVICLIQGLYLKSLIVFVVAGLTDALDGFLARVLQQKSVLGAYLDPLADKALVASSFITLSIIAVIPPWLTVIVISRDLVIMIGICILTLMSVPVAIKPAIVSKVTTIFQFLTVLVALASLAAPMHFDRIHVKIVIWATALFTVISGLTYIIRGINIINQTPEK
jgi:cardiolipin synthase (CMP-forming)